jgi:hypothetical protein
MKRVLFLAVLVTLSSRAGVVYFDISPAGTDAAVGLSPSNQVPPVTNSTGSGGPISAGVVFDTNTMVLQVAIGYGSAAGFTDLTGPAIDMHIHGPAAPGQNGEPLVELSPYNFVSSVDPAHGGIIFGNIAFPTNAVSNLLAGLTYINIHTAANTNGEIRGQLIPLVVSNSPPLLVCPSNSTVECGSPALVTAQVSDPDGDALTVVWTLNGSPVQTNTLPAQNPPVVNSVSFMGDLPVGTNTLGITVTDSATNSTSCTTSVTVVDTTPPSITRAWATPHVLWPPNHRMVDVVVHARVTDTCSTNSWSIIDVTSNEAVNGHGDDDHGDGDDQGNGNGHGHGDDQGHGHGHGHGDHHGGGSGNTSPDWIITGPHTVQLRAERSGNGHGRVYSISIQATDAFGNQSATNVVTVTVPHNR